MNDKAMPSEITDVCKMPAVALLARYRDRSLSPVEVCRALLDRIDRLNPKINAYCLVDHDGALAAARASEARWAAGAPSGRLDGVPVSVKDLILTKGWPTRRGSLTVDAAGPWEVDAPSVARLKAHNAVILGKTTTPEFGWKGVTDNPLTGITRNPWNLDRTPGGSSGGASAQLAASLGPLAIGTDGGGSIRIPAAFAGVVGLKPTFGRVPAWPLSPFGTVAHVGPMARTVADTGLMLSVLAEPDGRDWFELPPSGEDYALAARTPTLHGLKIAYSPDLGYARVDPEIAAAIAAAAKLFAQLGAQVEQVDPGIPNPLSIFTTHWFAGAYGFLKDLPAEKKAQLDPGLADIVRQGGEITLPDYLAAVQARGAMGVQWQAFLQRYDLLLTPSLSVPAFQVGRVAPAEGDGQWVDWTPFTYPFNLSQQPAISVPCGFTAAGLPIGLQLVAAKYRDALVLRAAAAYEAANPVHLRHPDL